VSYLQFFSLIRTCVLFHDNTTRTKLSQVQIILHRFCHLVACNHSCCVPPTVSVHFTNLKLQEWYLPIMRGAWTLFPCIPSLTDWFYWTLLQPLKGWIAKYNMYTKTENTNNRVQYKKNMHNVTMLISHGSVYWNRFPPFKRLHCCIMSGLSAIDLFFSDLPRICRQTRLAWALWKVKGTWLIWNLMNWC